MRLYLKDGSGEEWTGIVFSVVNNNIKIGGKVAFTYRDPLMTNIETVKKYINQRVEVRKNDGTTVLWEGVITTALYSSANKKWFVNGSTPGRMIDEIGCDYNGLLASGVVTAIDSDDTPPTITDINQTFTGLINSYVIFTDLETPTTEVIYPNSNSTFVDGGVAAETTDGTYAALDDATTSMYINDTNDRGLDYYGIEMEYTVTNEDESVGFVVNLYMEFEPRSDYSQDGSDCPLIEIYDFNAAGWKVADVAGITGLGRNTGGWNEWGAKINTKQIRFIRVTSDMANYFDGSHKCKVRVMCGETGDASDTVRIYQSSLVNSFSAGFAGGSYQIDAIDGSSLTFTGQTPHTDGIRAGDSFKVGDLLQVVAANIWREGHINWTALSMDTSSLIDATDLRGSYVGSVIKRYAEIEGWHCWDAIGWTYRVGVPAGSTSLSLTEANFIDFDFGADGSRTTAKVLTGCQSRVAVAMPSLIKSFISYNDRVMVDDFFPAQGPAIDASSTIVTATENINHPFEGIIDMDDGTDYSALALGQLITITLYTDKHVFTEQKIAGISYKQVGGGNLTCTIKVE